MVPMLICKIVVYRDGNPPGEQRCGNERYERDTLVSRSSVNKIDMANLLNLRFPPRNTDLFLRMASLTERGLPNAVDDCMLLTNTPFARSC